jgi:hypothetical protein
MTVIGINTVGMSDVYIPYGFLTLEMATALMMFIRIKALYHGRRVVQGLVAFLGLFSFVMNAYLLSKGVAVVHNPASGVRGTILYLSTILHSVTFFLQSMHDDFRRRHVCSRLCATF